jgi:hypothetical protein
MNVSHNQASCAARASDLNGPANPVMQLWHALAGRWARHLEDTRRTYETEVMSELSADTLRDIGAPEQWVARAVYRRESEEMKMQESRQWRNG